MVTWPFGKIAMVVIVDLSIRKLFVMLLMVCIAIFFVPGCSKNDDGGGSPTGGGSSKDGSLAEHTGANTVVTESNVDQVTTEITTTAFEVFGSAMQTASYGKAAAADVSINLKGDVDGNSSGKAAVNGKIVNKMDFTTYVGTDYDFTCTFFDFSDDGELYFGGSLSYKGSAKYSKNTLESRTIIIKGGMKFNGKYSGTEDLTTTVTTIISTGKTTYNGTTTVTSGGKTFTHGFKF